MQGNFAMLENQAFPTVIKKKKKNGNFGLVKTPPPHTLFHNCLPLIFMNYKVRGTASQ